jgi:hypothetical protein
MLYASFSQGFKSGAFNANALSATPVDQPGKGDAYEAGSGSRRHAGRDDQRLGVPLYYQRSAGAGAEPEHQSDRAAQCGEGALQRRRSRHDLHARRAISACAGHLLSHAVFTSFPNAQVFIPVVGRRRAQRRGRSQRDRQAQRPLARLDVELAADYTFHAAKADRSCHRQCLLFLQILLDGRQPDPSLRMSSSMPA